VTLLSDSRVGSGGCFREGGRVAVMAEAQVGDASRLPPVLAILPFRNKVLLPGAIVKIRVNAPARFFFYFFL
jgi:hypothetical protein